MKLLKVNLPVMIIVLLLFTTVPGFAEPVKIVQWWGAYVPDRTEQTTGKQYRSSFPDSLHCIDLDDDNVFNDTLIWFRFSTSEALNPLPQNPIAPKSYLGYRINRPVARFYGGIVGRYTNISENADDVLFNRFAQASVQDDGATPCSYNYNPNNDGSPCSPDAGNCPAYWPDNTLRLRNDSRYPGPYWSDMTLFVVDPSWTSIGTAFHNTADAQINFTAVYLWKKEDFLNGGAKMDEIVFDVDSKLSVDMTRNLYGVEELRFVVLDGEQYWISKFFYSVADSVVKTVELNPQGSDWAVYDPSGSDSDAIKALTLELQDAAFDHESTEYQDGCRTVREAVDKMTFDPSSATFGDHIFTDIQAVGLYCASYEFAHEDMMFVFDNFKVYASGTVPAIEAVVLDTNESYQETSPARAGFSGGISLDGTTFHREVSLCSKNGITIRGDISVYSTDIGRQADIVAFIGMSTSPESKNDEIKYNLLDVNGTLQAWDGKKENLIPFEENVTLQSDQSYTLYQGTPGISGFFRIFFGYRLEDGILVLNHKPFEIIIGEMFD